MSFKRVHSSFSLQIVLQRPWTWHKQKKLRKKITNFLCGALEQFFFVKFSVTKRYFCEIYCECGTAVWIVSQGDSMRFLLYLFDGKFYSNE